MKNNPKNKNNLHDLNRYQLLLTVRFKTLTTSQVDSIVKCLLNRCLMIGCSLLLGRSI